MRAPLWQQRKRAADLLARGVAVFESFPILLETYRECVRDVFDLAAATGDAARDPARADPRDVARFAEAFAVRLGAAVLLHRQLHL